MRKSLTNAAMLGVIGLAASASALGAETIWRLDSNAPACSGNSSGWTCASPPPATSPPNVVATPWYFTSESASGTLSNTNAAIQRYSGGAGVIANGEGSSSPNHSVDNFGKIDGVLFNFWDAVNLTKVTTGWVGPGDGDTNPSQAVNPRDSDFSLLAYTLPGNPTSALSGKTAAELLLVANGWKLIGHYDGTGNAGGETKPVNAVGETYKYWLLTAYNPNFGGAVNGADTGVVTGPGNDQYDFLKLYSVTFTQNGRVPEPASLALVGVALAGLWGSRRRRNG